MTITLFHDWSFHLENWDGHCGDCGRFAKTDGTKAYCKCGWEMENGEPIQLITMIPKAPCCIDKIYLDD